MELPATMDLSATMELPALTADPVEPAVAKAMRTSAMNQNLYVPNAWRSVCWAIAIPTAWAVLTVAATLVGHPVFWLGVWGAQSVLLLSVVAGLHDGVHRLLFRSSTANHVGSQVCGMALLVPYGIYRAYHLQHHSSTHAEGDSEPLEQFSSLWQYLVIAPLNIVLFILLLWVDGLRTVVGRPPAYVRTAAQHRVALVSLALTAAAVAGAVAATVAAPWLMFSAWWIPYLSGTVLIGMLLLPEHYLCRVGPASAFETTRTTTSNAVIRFFFWGTNFHAEHHLASNVPSYRLAVLHDEFSHEIQNVESSYTGWHLKLVRLLASRTQPGIEDLRGPAAAPVRSRS